MAGEPAVWGSKNTIEILTGRAAPLTTAGGAITFPRSTYLALLTSMPTDTTILSTMSEVNTAGYTRALVTWAAPAIPSGGVLYQSTNTAQINFGPFTATMATDAVAVALVSASSGTTGDFIFWWSLDVPESAAINETIQIPAGKLVLAHN